MTHVDEGRLLAFLDGELAGEERAAVAAHIEVCALCTAALNTLRAAATKLSAALRVLDAPAPIEAVGVRPAWRRTRGRAVVVQRSLLRAAVLVLGFAAVGTAALPDSPVRSWFGDVWGWAAAFLEDEPAEPVIATTAADPVEPPDPAPEPAAISLLPTDGRVRILIEEPAPEVRLRVQLVDGERVAVYAFDAAADARFRTGQDRIEVLGAGAGELRVALPYSLRSATVEVDGRIYVTKDGAELRSMIGAGDTGTEILLPLSQPEPDR